MKKTFIMSLVFVALLTISCSFFVKVFADKKIEDQSKVEPRGPVYQNILVVDFCEGTLTHAFYGNFSPRYAITNITKPVSSRRWTTDLGVHYVYKYLDSEGYEVIPFDDGYTYTENNYVNRACGSYGS